MTVLLGLSTYRQTDSNPRSRFTYSPFRTPSFRLRDGPVRQNGNHPFATGFLVAALARGHPTAVSLGVIIGGVIIMSGIALVCLPNYPIKVPYFDKKTMSGAAEAKYLPRFGKKGSGSSFLPKYIPMNPSTCARRRKRRRNSNRSSQKPIGPWDPWNGMPSS
jgi:hypothetical protein